MVAPRDPVAAPTVDTQVGGRLNWDEYAGTWARLHGGFDPRRATPVVQGWLRMSYQIGSVLSRLRVSPTAVTVA